MCEYLNAIREQFKPKYHELTAYLTAITCVFLFIFHSEFRQIYFDLLNGPGFGKAMPVFMILTLIATVGFFLSIIQVFLKRKKSWLEKTCMGVFILGANGFAGIAAGLEMLPSRWSLLALIPLWNILIGLSLLYQIGLQKFDITDENAALVEVLASSGILLIIFATVNFKYNLSWAMIFSICVFCSSLLSLFSWIVNYFRFQSLSKA